MIANTNNCIIFNSLLFNSNSTISSYDDPIAIAFRKFNNWDSHTKRGIKYFFRSEKIVTLIKQRRGHITQTWDYYYDTYVKDIIDSLTAEQYNQVLEKMKAMLDSCEAEFGLVTPRGGIYINSYIPFSETTLQNININDKLLALNTSLNEQEESIVTGYINSIQQLVTLVSSSGIRLTCAAITPVTLEFGDILIAANCKGRNIPVMDNGNFRWEQCIDVFQCGTGEVVNILTNDDSTCYAAGDEKNKWIWTQRIPK